MTILQNKITVLLRFLVVPSVRYREDRRYVSHQLIDCADCCCSRWDDIICTHENEKRNGDRSTQHASCFGFFVERNDNIVVQQQIMILRTNDGKTTRPGTESINQTNKVFLVILFSRKSKLL